MTGKADTTLLRVGNERLLELILENAPLSINALTTDLRYAVVGAAGSRMLGTPA